MRTEFHDADVRQVLSLTKFHLRGSQFALEASRLRLVESQRKIMMSQQAIAKSDALIKALRSGLQPSDEQESTR